MTVTAVRACWWCGREAEVNTGAVASNGMLRDDSTMDGSESWICADSAACSERSPWSGARARARRALRQP